MLRRTLTRLVACAAIAVCPAGAAEWHRQVTEAMGTRIEAEVWHADPRVARTALELVSAEMARVERTFSPHLPDSELSVLNRLSYPGPVKVSDEMRALLSASRKVAELTGGAFDITYASAGHLYDYRAGKRPAAAQLERARDAIDYRHVKLDGSQVSFARAGVTIDLGGIAKGHAVDRSIERLRSIGIRHAMVAAGGDSRLLGDRRGEPWTVAVRHPRRQGEVAAILPLFDTAISTSGDYERFFEEDGERVHHILDPATGRSANGVQSVTILGPATTFTDALSTSVFVLGLERGMALVDGLEGIDAILVDAAGRLHFSNDLAQLDD